MPNALVSLGANLGDRESTLSSACQMLASADGCQVLAVSRWIRTEPVGGPAGQEPFLNGAALLATSLSARGLLELLQHVETAHGRKRTVRWGPRTLDLDLLLYGEAQIDEADLRVPHSGLEFRRFVLEPAAEIAPGMVHPRLGWNLRRLAEHLDRSLPWIAVTGAGEAERSRIVAAVEQASPVPLSALPANEIADRAPPSAAVDGKVWFISTLPNPLTPQEACIPRLTFVLDGPAAPWGPSLSLHSADAEAAVSQAAAAIAAMLPFP